MVPNLTSEDRNGPSSTDTDSALDLEKATYTSTDNENDLSRGRLQLTAPTPAVAPTSSIEQIQPTTDGHSTAPLDWTGSADPENPHNWPLSKRTYHSAAPALCGFAV